MFGKSTGEYISVIKIPLIANVGLSLLGLVLSIIVAIRSKALGTIGSLQA